MQSVNEPITVYWLVSGGLAVFVVAGLAIIGFFTKKMIADLNVTIDKHTHTLSELVGDMREIMIRASGLADTDVSVLKKIDVMQDKFSDLDGRLTRIEAEHYTYHIHRKD